jgi:hypothetical protein
VQLVYIFEMQWQWSLLLLSENVENLLDSLLGPASTEFINPTGQNRLLVEVVTESLGELRQRNHFHNRKTDQIVII